VDASGDALGTDGIGTPGSYIVEHASTVLAREVGVLDIVVRVAGRRVVVSGSIETAVRKQEIGTVLARLLPQHEIVNEVMVTRSDDAPGDVEELR
jgi:hypothetical protein